jgi:hypothetical protein
VKIADQIQIVFMEKTRFNLLDESTFWLSENPSDTGSVSWDAQLPRVASWVKLEVKSSKVVFYVFNTHCRIRIPA